MPGVGDIQLVAHRAGGPRRPQSTSTSTSSRSPRKASYSSWNPYFLAIFVAVTVSIIGGVLWKYYGGAANKSGGNGDDGSYDPLPVSPDHAGSGERSRSVEREDDELSRRPPDLLPRVAPGPLPLSNVGNTCFLNSLLQCVAFTPGFLEAALAFNDEPKGLFLEFLIEYANAREKRSRNGPSTLSLRAYFVKKGAIVEDAQSDPTDVLSTLLEEVRKSMTALSGAGPKMDQPTGMTILEEEGDPILPYVALAGDLSWLILEQRQPVPADGTHQWRGHTVNYLSLPLPHAAASLAGLLATAAVTVWPSFNNALVKLACPEPNAVVFHLARAVANNRRVSKHRVSVPVEEHIDLSTWFKDDTCRPPLLNLRYRLYGVIAHLGWGTQSGHYVAFVSNGGTWYEANDRSIRRTSSEQVFSETATSWHLVFYAREDWRLTSLLP